MDIAASDIIFYVLAIVIAVSSVLTVTSRKLLHSAVYLLFTLLATAGIYFELKYHFLAAVQISVYIGGILVLLVFSIVLTSKVGEKMDTASVCKATVTAVIVIAGAILCGYVINKYLPDAKMLPAQQEMDMNTIGHSLLGTGRFEYILPFEAISVLLLACIIGGILIAKNNKKKEGEED